jgi:hypothetical protein
VRFQNGGLHPPESQKKSLFSGRIWLFLRWYGFFHMGDNLPKTSRKRVPDPTTTSPILFDLPSLYEPL